MRCQLVCGLFFGLFLFACKIDAAKEEDTPNEHNSAVYLMPGLDHGLLQSPINILSNEISAARHQVTLNFTGLIDSVRNLGHTVQLDFEPGNTITVDGSTFEFKQIHFHTPSEHLIDGITYPMEMHVVNTLLDQHPEGHPGYLVLAFLIKMGQESEFLNRFISEIPEDENHSSTIDLNMVKQTEFFQKDSLENLVNSCYHYMGSLTTPPNTESVSWFITKNIFEASPEQIRTINKIEGDNARHIQSRYGRNITN